MTRTEILEDPSGRITVSFPYNPLLVSKVKTIEGHKWNSAETNCSFLKPQPLEESGVKATLYILQEDEKRMPATSDNTG